MLRTSRAAVSETSPGFSDCPAVSAWPHATGRLAPRASPDPLMPVAIIGLGYVGLPLSLQFARCGVRVQGLDIDPAKVDAINAGRSYLQHIDSNAIAEHV